MSAYWLRRHQLAPLQATARVPVPLLDVRSEGRGKGGQRAVAAPLAVAAVENRRRAACRRQALHRSGQSGSAKALSTAWQRLSTGSRVHQISRFPAISYPTGGRI